MSASDLPAVNALAARIHPSFPEDAAVFAERLRLYPDGCRVFERGNGIEAYVVSHPWFQIGPPVLNSLLGELPATPAVYYIHDLALAPEVRGLGAAPEIVAWLAAHALASGLSGMSLIAVNGSSGFWQRQGFAVVEESALAGKLATYDEAACYMRRDLKD